MNEINKQNILSKAQKMQQDPIYNTLSVLGYAIGAIICVVTILLRILVEKIFVVDGALIMCGMYTFFYWASFIINQKNKNNLFLALFFTTIFFILLVIFLQQIM